MALRGSLVLFCWAVLFAFVDSVTEREYLVVQARAGLRGAKPAALTPANLLKKLGPGRNDPVGVTYGIPSDYYCTGRVFDEPRRVRLRCRKDPPRVLNCKCQKLNHNSRQVPCFCGGPVTNEKGPIYLVEAPSMH